MQFATSSSLLDILGNVELLGALTSYLVASPEMASRHTREATFEKHGVDLEQPDLEMTMSGGEWIRRSGYMDLTKNKG